MTDASAFANGAPQVTQQHDASVGIVGLGNMGAAIARRLARVGRVHAVELSASRAASAAASGVTVVDDLASLADACEVIVLSLPHPAASFETVDALCRVGRPDMLLIETSTVSPADVRRFVERTSAARVDLLGAAVLSGVAAMDNGRAQLLVGGMPAAIERARPWLTSMSASLRTFDDPAQAMALKVVLNAVGHTLMVTLLEGAAMSAECGVEMSTLVSLLSDPLSSMSKALSHRLGERVPQRDYTGGMSVRSVRKDNELALKMAMEQGVPLFTIQAAQTVYEIAARGARADDDYCAIADLWEQWGAPPAERHASGTTQGSGASS